MSSWLDANADGFALLTWAVFAGLGLLLVALFVERRLRPSDRRWIKRIRRNEAGRACQRAGHDIQ